MSALWPRLPEAVATELYEKVLVGSEFSPAVHHPEQIYAPVGGRVSEATIRGLLDEATALATEYGYPNKAGDAMRIEFDRAAAPVVRSHVDISWAEAGNRGVWSFISLVVLPHLTAWRFGTTNRERWLASDLTRHTWARLWWQAVVFDDDPALLRSLTESDLNALLERRTSIGGDPRLVRALGSAVVDTPTGTVPRRHLIRDVTRRLRRHLAFIDVRALTDAQLRAMCETLTTETVKRYRPDQDTD
jgi:hypothetical protein